MAEVHVSVAQAFVNHKTRFETWDGIGGVKLAPDWEVTALCVDLLRGKFVCLSLHVVIRVSVVVSRSFKFTAPSRLSASLPEYGQEQPERALTNKTKSDFK